MSSFNLKYNKSTIELIGNDELIDNIKNKNFIFPNDLIDLKINIPNKTFNCAEEVDDYFKSFYNDYVMFEYCIIDNEGDFIFYYRGDKDEPYPYSEDMTSEYVFLTIGENMKKYQIDRCMEGAVDIFGSSLNDIKEEFKNYFKKDNFMYSIEFENSVNKLIEDGDM